MGEIVSSVILGLMSTVTAVITTAGLSRPARIRHELRDVTASLAQIPPEAAAHRALSRLVDLRSADLAALQLVRYDSFLLGLSALLILGGFGAVVLGRDVSAAVVAGWVAEIGGYLIAFTHVPNVNRLRRRQARAIVAGRPSGLLPIDASIPLRRSTVRQDVYRPEEYPIFPFLRRQLERSRRGRREARVQREVNESARRPMTPGILRDVQRSVQ